MSEFICIQITCITPPPFSSLHLSILIRSEIHVVSNLGGKETVSWFNFTYRYIDDVLSINNMDFENYLGKIYPVKLDIQDTTVSITATCLLEVLYNDYRYSLEHKNYFISNDYSDHVTLHFLNARLFVGHKIKTTRKLFRQM